MIFALDYHNFRCQRQLPRFKCHILGADFAGYSLFAASGRT